MRNAKIAPLWESALPPAYAGSKRVVYLLTDELVCQGHEVILLR